jgi:hypothetical protein
MQIGFVHSYSFKLLAKIIKKRFANCKHNQALEGLARACGLRNFSEVRDSWNSGVPESSLMSGTREVLLLEWKSSLSTQFSIDIHEILSDEELDTWYDRLFFPRVQLSEGRDGFLTLIEPLAD